MISKFTNHIIHNLIQTEVIDPDEIEIYEFGLETFLANIISMITVAIIGALLGQLWECILFQIVFISLRSWAGGYHASSQWRCFILSNVVIIMVLWLSRYLPSWFMLGGGLVILFVAAGLILLLAPVEHENNPLNSDEIKVHKQRVRIMVLINVVIGCVLYGLSNSLYSIVVLAVLTVAFSLLAGLNHKYHLLIAAFLCLSITVPQEILAEEVSGQKDALDVTFVVDVSGSMRTNDPNGIALDMVKAFVDTVHIQNIRVGFVAYNDKIVSSSSPVSIIEQSERDRLKGLIDTTSYSGNTDIGLGLMNAYQSMPEEKGRSRIIVLISDGESDLTGSNTGRTLEQSNQELDQVVEACREEAVPIYTVAFGTYGGNKTVLENIADRTNANTYSAQNPELLMEVLYDIFNDNMSYKIQKVSTGIYARGSQEIRCTLDEAYLNEIDILLISPREIGESVIHYGDEQIEFTKTSYYAVGKIADTKINRGLKELTINTNTSDGQYLDAYVISYRDLEPILNIETEMSRNQDYLYEVYFKDKDGSVIRDEAFYQTFHWNMAVTDSAGYQLEDQQSYELKDGILQSGLNLGQSGEYTFTGEIHDNLGAYQFRTGITVVNTAPTGELPEIVYNRLSKGGDWNLNDYFQDSEGDNFTYTVETVGQQRAELHLNGEILTIIPLKSGTQVVNLQVSDGEAVLSHLFQIRIIPVWQAYWWAFVIVLVLVLIVVWKRLNRPKPEPQTFADFKSRCQFTGRLDLYFTVLPGEKEIPPLVFQMHKLRSSKIRLGDLLKDYPEETKQLELNQVYLIADEARKMILFHASDATIMIGNSIVCRQVRYNVSFGDVIYITSADGAYDLELRYISVIQ